MHYELFSCHVFKTFDITRLITFRSGHQKTFGHRLQRFVSKLVAQLPILACLKNPSRMVGVSVLITLDNNLNYISNRQKFSWFLVEP